MANDDVENEAEGTQRQDKRRVILIAVAAIGMMISATALAHYMGLLLPLFAKFSGPTDQPAQVVETGPVFYDLPEILVNLNNVETRKTFLKLRVSLELASQREAPRVEARMPIIVDNFHAYLRELRVDEIKGSEGMHRLQKELMARVTAATAPARVDALLFKELLVQ